MAASRVEFGVPSYGYCSRRCAPDCADRKTTEAGLSQGREGVECRSDTPNKVPRPIWGLHGQRWKKWSIPVCALLPLAAWHVPVADGSCKRRQLRSPMVPAQNGSVRSRVAAHPMDAWSGLPREHLVGNGLLSLTPQPAATMPVASGIAREVSTFHG
jgi:hypothetical protein